jgi:hypothetical protein
MEMKIKTLAFLILLSAMGYGQEELPDNYLPINFTMEHNELIGKSEYLEGFIFSMKLPSDTLTTVPEREELYAIVEQHKIKGTLTYPNEKVTEIEYELVSHRNTTGIYMKTTLGYFLWEMLDFNDNGISLAINWWYYPPATTTDLAILNMTDSLLSNAGNWHQNDDRKCDNDIESNSWSLFCALKYSTLEKAKEYNHHSTAIQTVRYVIDDLQPNNGYEHTLKDFNNNPSITHAEILEVIEEAKKRIRKELENPDNGE